MFKIILTLSFIFFNVLSANLLQDAIDKAPSGSILKLPKGVYKGSIKIDKPITIIGKEDGVIIDGEQTGTVITITGPYVTLRNLTIVGSGNRHDSLDAAIKISNSKQSEISDCIIKDSLFGIDIAMTNNSLFSNNYITSKDLELGLRGDGLRLWYSNDNIVKNNKLIKSRDMVVWYSHGNQILSNYGEQNRYSLHFMYAGKNIVKDNNYKLNSVGIFFMYSKDTIATGNTITSSQGATGMGIGLKDVSNFTLEDNTIIYCAQGIYIDRSPFEPDTKNWINNNKILYNSEALHFHSLSENNVIKKNTILGNIEDIVNDSRGAKTNENEILGNYWDNYEGFDKDGDNIGDTSHKVFQYADQLWMYNKDVKFFYGSPVISLLNFLSKLAPFSQPVFLLEDTEPKLKM
ncbi:nitrous oxide reductase family maturation protein NosD [Poseidonibacter ostreae]|jgi:nitrous oxidase accessory protein|uniref:Nitrous oxide reductase family maturation protein NosD n=1 Tax=Poseidonibacter ostreae TaxID=2654171 RepID=A0A6L4WXK5_9BACT|nr:nitrous oxide reductase family maturation protein NosD [Poseidonibacter ostreae]KAB7886455.1 nitrous oxide reductase family maturation protein NosD [Poseidonibacter ostreae]KAB7890174.1 nitrous oxide reductase family maturation protein NosD [Poseidonibacter ostreae]KAB7892579.1 nitrous oxide reductase family maturation protein NosD [Poseidonibacter ostreae]MAC83841.1 nitrous oxidase accessory protein [Arcobacter sp.]|tara:strand:- start:1865 stop:3076 length:1212 start_codon:yes stop_codon:yes gene_type:complete